MTHDKTTGLDPNVLGAESQSEALKALHYIARTIGWLEVVPPYGDAVDRTKEADKAISCIETVRAALSQSPQGDCALCGLKLPCIHVTHNDDPRNKPAPQPETGAEIEALQTSIQKLKNLQSEVLTTKNGLAVWAIRDDLVEDAERAIIFNFEKLKAALTARKVDAQTWQPIETAPRNERILIIVDGYVKIAKFEHYDRVWVVFACDDSWYQEEYHEAYPTHWMHLPPAPASDDGVK